MIVPMKKLSVITQSKDAVSAVAQLRSLGVVHVKDEQPPSGKDLEACDSDLNLLQQALVILSEEVFAKGAASASAQGLEDWKTASRHIIDLGKRYEHLKEYSRHLSVRISQWQAWGDFDPEELAALEKNNVFVRLCQVPVAELKNFPQDVLVRKISSSRGTAYCAVISREKGHLPFKELELPKMSLSRMQERLKEDRRVLETIRRDVGRCLAFKPFFEKAKRELLQKKEFISAVSGMGRADSLAYLSGFIPYDKVGDMQDAAKKQQWGLLVTDPSEDEAVPTLIRNPRWVSLIAPLFKVIEVIPGYHEVDISLWVLIFLSVFFGMLIGDAGYGAIFFILTFLASRKFAKKLKDRSVFLLSYMFSTCAMLWGFLSGTFFGQAWLPSNFEPLLPALRQDTSVQAFCFFLGALHLSIGHLVRAAMKYPSRTALSDVGWVSVLWGAFFLAKTLISGAAFPAFAKWLFIAGPVFVVFFSSDNKNLLKGVGAGLGNLLLNFVNSFTDVVSYIRLFAVGLATVAVADAFNAMALSVGFNSVVSGFIAAFILLLGHLLNLVLGPMAVLVHGVRLNVLEFCNHVDVKWSGFAYKPLTEGQ